MPPKTKSLSVKLPMPLVEEFKYLCNLLETTPADVLKDMLLEKLPEIRADARQIIDGM